MGRTSPEHTYFARGRQPHLPGSDAAGRGPLRRMQTRAYRCGDDAPLPCASARTPEPRSPQFIGPISMGSPASPVHSTG